MSGGEQKALGSLLDDIREKKWGHRERREEQRAEYRARMHQQQAAEQQQEVTERLEPEPPAAPEPKAPEQWGEAELKKVEALACDLTDHTRHATECIFWYLQGSEPWDSLSAARWHLERAESLRRQLEKLRDRFPPGKDEPVERRAAFALAKQAALSRFTAMHVLDELEGGGDDTHR